MLKPIKLFTHEIDRKGSMNRIGSGSKSERLSPLLNQRQQLRQAAVKDCRSQEPPVAAAPCSPPPRLPLARRLLWPPPKLPTAILQSSCPALPLPSPYQEDGGGWTVPVGWRRRAAGGCGDGRTAARGCGDWRTVVRGCGLHVLSWGAEG